MSGNKLLAENTIRRFMKLANVDAMTDNFIKEYAKDEDVQEEEVQEEENITEEEEEMEMEMDPELDAEDPEADADMEPAPEMDAEPEAEMGAADMSLTEEEAQLLIDLGKRLEEAMGGELGPEEPAEEPAMDEPEAEEPELDMGAEEEVPADEEEPALQEALVNEVLKRVTKRLVAAKLKNRK